MGDEDGIQVFDLQLRLRQAGLQLPDAESAIDQQAALLDHELHHLEVQKEGNGRFKFDDLNRPKISMRPHDFEFGWFSIIAKRHPGIALECVQAKTIMDKAGQLFWPELGVGGAGASELPPQEELSMSVSVDGGEAVTFKPGQLQRLADALQKAPAEASGETVFDEDEGLIEQCVEVIRTEQKASVSLIQRRLRLGYTRATRIMDELERRGIVGPAKGAEPRDILIGA